MGNRARGPTFLIRGPRFKRSGQNTYDKLGVDLYVVCSLHAGNEEGGKEGWGEGRWEGQVNMYKHRKTNYMVQLCITV